jgi:hypothetical protein
MKIFGNRSADGIWSHDEGNKVGATERMYNCPIRRGLPVFGAWEKSGHPARLLSPSEPF